MKKFFWDSYALIEIIKGNPNYSNYKDEEVVFSVFNLVEIYFSILKGFGKKIAGEVYDEYSPAVIKIPGEVLKEAMEFRLASRGKSLSYADVIGYIYALKKGFVFLTGDKEFKNMKSVEFVK